jgi:hypothetical protein
MSSTRRGGEGGRAETRRAQQMSEKGFCNRLEVVLTKKKEGNL